MLSLNAMNASFASANSNPESVNAINHAYGMLRGRRTEKALRKLLAVIKDHFGSDCADIDQDTDAHGNKRWSLWVAFCETEVAARVTLSEDGSLTKSGDNRHSLGHEIHSEALWAVENGVALDDNLASCL